MVNYDACAEHPLQPPCELRRQGYFGHEHQRLTPEAHYFVDEMYV